MKKVGLACLMLSSSFIGTIAISANIPTCPATADYPVVKVDYVRFFWTWIGTTAPISSIWDTGIAYLLNDEPLRTMDQAQQIAYVNKIRESTRLVSSTPQQVWWNPGDPSRGYFWACDYTIAPQYQTWADKVEAFSDTIFPSNIPVDKRTEHSLAEKIAQFRSVG